MKNIVYLVQIYLVQIGINFELPFPPTYLKIGHHLCMFPIGILDITGGIYFSFSICGTFYTLQCFDSCLHTPVRYWNKI